MHNLKVTASARQKEKKPLIANVIQNHKLINNENVEVKYGLISVCCTITESERHDELICRRLYKAIRNVQKISQRVKPINQN